MRQSRETALVSSRRLHEDSLTQILANVVEEVKLSISKDISGADILYSLLTAPWLLSLLKVYQRLQWHMKTAPIPYLPYALGISQQMVADLQRIESPSPEARELYRLLRDPHLKAFLTAHDMVAQKDYEPVLLPLPRCLPEDEEAMRIVCLVKNNQPLGATIRRNELTGEIFVARVIHGGLADRSGLLNAGDKLVEVNGQPVEGLEPEQIIQILTYTRGTIVFKVVPISDRPVNNHAVHYVRAMIDYSPQQDPAIPCTDAGMAFRKGDVLEVVDQTDALWWQAKKMPSTSACAGLIPSTDLLRRKQREIWMSHPFQTHSCSTALSALGEEDDIDTDSIEADEDTSESEDSECNSILEGIYIAGFRRSMRLCQKRSRSIRMQPCYAHCGSSCYSSLAYPYEEVARYQRRPEDQPRLIALMGPSGVGVNELRRRLIAFDPKTYQGPVPHTTRPIKKSEQSGREYHFISEELFENMLYNHRFLEYGEYKGHLYGTSISAIKSLLDSGKICVIDISPHGIQAVRTHDLKAFIIFVKPPSAARMKKTRTKARISSNCYTKRPFRDDDFQEIEDVAKRMECLYSQFFDYVIVNDKLQDSCMQLLTAVRRAQEEPHWVPTSWLRPCSQS